MVMPIIADAFEELPIESNYDPSETSFVIEGFRKGFDLGYEGPEKIKITSNNLKFRGVGDEIELWNKVMKEIKLGRFAGPFREVPFEYYIQSPIGLVPKDNGKSTRLIFHSSHPRGMGRSVNANIPVEKCSGKYPDFSEAIKLCMAEGKSCRIGRSDVRSAFRNLGILPSQFKFLVMKARSPIDHKWYFMVDKALPFRSSISCSHYQRVSRAIAHIVEFKTGKKNVCYLDDHLFIAMLKMICNGQLHTFLQVCKTIGMPISEEKTFWGTTILTFLGLLIDMVNQTVSIPREKIEKAQLLIDNMLHKNSKKVTLAQVQKLCGFLNFLCRAIVPGRAFTRRLYAYTSSKVLKPHHHMKITSETCSDLHTWQTFLKHPTVYCQPFMDFSTKLDAKVLNMYSDASRSAFQGFGVYCGRNWMYSKWDSHFILRYCPSIEYLELFALVDGFLKWGMEFKNLRIVLFCDNKSVRDMVNANSSKCKNCMVLIRKLVLHSLMWNIWVYIRYVKSKDNKFADQLSRLKINQFKREGMQEKDLFNETETAIPHEIWPMSKI